MTGLSLPLLAPSQSVCTSESQSFALNAVVRVVCSTGEFVSIEPAPGTGFAGTYDVAQRLPFGPGTAPLGLRPEVRRMGIVAGTVTSLRVTSLGDREKPVHMLVSF
jgi:hypothetical protein